MTRVVLDTNLVVSAILSPKGKPARILEMALDGKLDFVLSPAMLKEISLVLNYQKVRKLFARRSVTREMIKDTLQKTVKTTIMVSGKAEVRYIDKDPSDNMVLSCAVEGRADFVISGDHHLTDLASFEGILIANPDAFLKLTSPRSFPSLLVKKL
ncbi:MAG: putative toxin-antitoxin system toxin component, PIN family [Syntrophales bacterium LBB04]|nr:putative toxin-antitoxin system toxin component, PIN family [Syntrophales bacterium LBB04]